MAEEREIRFVICLPLSWPFIHREAALSLWTLFDVENMRLCASAIETASHRPARYWRYADSSFPLDLCRNKMVEGALKHDPDYIIFLDADHVFPGDTIAKLLYVMEAGAKGWPDGKLVDPKEIDILSALYFKKYGVLGPVSGVCFDGKGGHPQHWPIGIDFKGLVPCDIVGAGCLIVRAEVFRQIPAPWFKYQETGEEPGPNVTEDVWFCQEAARHGFRIWTDTQNIIQHLVTRAVGGEAWQSEYVQGSFDVEGKPRREHISPRFHKFIDEYKGTWPGVVLPVKREG